MNTNQAVQRSSSTFESFKYPNFRLWFTGQLVSLIGTWMQSTAQGYLIYSLTGSAAYLGYISLAAGIPTWIFTLYGGLIADRIPRRKLLIMTQTSSMLLAFVLSVLVFTGVVQPWHILVLAFFLGVTNAFDAPARQAFVRELVGRETMTNAIALNSGMFNLGTVIGPAAAGLTYAAIGPAWCFAINGVSFIAVITALFLMRIDQEIPSRANRNAIKDVQEGVRYVLASREIRSLILNLGFLSLFGFGVIALLPAWAVKVLHGDVRVNGWLYSARGLGAVISTLIIASVGHRKIRGRLWSAGNLLLPLFWILFSFINQLPWSLMVAVLIGLSFILAINLTNAMVQTSVSDAMRGRVMGIYTLVFFGLTPVGSLLAGLSAERWGEQTTVLASGLILLLLALFTALRMPYLRHLD